MSIYESIKSNINEQQKLPSDFSLAEKSAPNELQFAPGAMDGIWVYHGGMGGTGEDLDGAVVNIFSLVKQYLNTKDESFVKKLEALLDEYRALHVADPFLQTIRENPDEIVPQELIEFAFEKAKTSDNVELVKFCISLFGLFDLEKYESIRNVAAILGVYDDFTLFSVVAASNWTDGTGVVFWIAQRATGWGKVHAVERLEPETDKIREWILREGCQNGVMDAYLGLTCAKKGDLLTALRQKQIDNDLFESISIIIDALLDEGPVPGVSEYEHAQEALELYLHHAKEHAKTLQHLWYVLNVRYWAVDEEIKFGDSITNLCNEIIGFSNWKEKIFTALEEKDDMFTVVNVASRIDVDISAKLFMIVKQEPLEYYQYLRGLFEIPDMASELIGLYEEILPLSEMANGMGDYIFPEELCNEHNSLDFILPLLASYPMQGISLIKTGLNSHVVRGRNMACRAISGWVKALEKPIEEISPELFAELKRINEIEVNEKTKESLEKLIMGESLDD